MADYTAHIVRILYEAGDDGLRLRLLSRHVFNAVNSFFEPVDREEVHKRVAAFVPAHAQGRSPLFERCSHGVYRLCHQSEEVRAILAEMGVEWECGHASGKSNTSDDPTQLFLFSDEDFG